MRILKFFLCEVFEVFFLLSLIHFLEGSKLFVVTARKLIDKVLKYFFLKISPLLFFVKIYPLPGGKPGLPGHSREAG